ncbi:hypothetical protein [Streptomyces hirsutus]|uniref:hypothetical protein n=1 Tax=Streptomyces hirsutus TaxID=35620 RepID=UPI001146A112|nr:hypothetical protein [Streptomyces hirsutus]
MEIGQGARTGLLPEGRQNYVVARENYAESVERAKGCAGDSIRPDSLGGGPHTEGDDAPYTGAFRTETVPACITLRIDGGAAVEAGMLRLPGDPGWGTYYAFGDASAADTGVTVTAYAGDGGVLFEQHADASPRDWERPRRRPRRGRPRRGEEPVRTFVREPPEKSSATFRYVCLSG